MNAIEKLVSIKDQQAELDYELKCVMPLAIEESLTYGKRGSLGVFNGNGTVTLKFVKVKPSSPELSELKELLKNQGAIASLVNAEGLQDLSQQIEDLKRKILYFSQTNEGREIEKQIETLEASIGEELKPQLAVSFKVQKAKK